MVTVLQIGPSKALASTVLYDLGQINVFCGKNNSGKSTVLEAIDAAQRRDGMVLTEEAVKAMTAQLGPAWERFNSADHNSWQSMFTIAGATHKDCVWFENDTTAFLETLRNQISNGTGVGGVWNQSYVADKYPKLFPQRVISVRIPETRRLQLEAEIAVSHIVNPNGTGLLNYLFYAKNQLIGEQPRRIYAAIQAAFVDISEGFSFDITIPHDAPPGITNEVRLFFSKNLRDWVPARDCGFGLQELLLILYFAIEPSAPIVCVEEPESHMHPEMQRKLAIFLRAQTSKQYFFSTHSSVFLRPNIADRTFLVSMDDGSISITDASSRAMLLSELGYDVLDNLVSDVVILTEGPTDVPILEEFLRKRGIWEKYRIRFWPLGGDIMASIDLTVILQHTHAIALVDHDPGSESVRKRFLEECRRLGIPATRLSRCAIENYFTLDALRSVFHSQISSAILAIDPDTPLKAQIGFDPKKKGWNVVKAMSHTDIEGTDLSEFIDMVGKMCAMASVAETSGNVQS